jgi:hypothetical protein
VERVELTPREQDLWDKIDFGPRPIGGSHDSLRASLEPAHDLARSLIDRGAIPDIRMQYFTDPALNIGTKKSHKQVFEANGTKGDSILRHPNFIPYLRYFVLGPELPETTMEAFRELLGELGTITSGDRRALVDFARREAKGLTLDPRAAAEEFFKLALECGLDVDDARAMRDAVMRLRRR